MADKVITRTVHAQLELSTIVMMEVGQMNIRIGELLQFRTVWISLGWVFKYQVAPPRTAAFRIPITDITTATLKAQR